MGNDFVEDDGIGDGAQELRLHIMEMPAVARLVAWHRLLDTRIQENKSYSQGYKKQRKQFQTPSSTPMVCQ